MNCDDLRRRLTEYSERALPEELCREVEQHLASCASCADVEHDLVDLARLCRECPQPRLPESLRKRLESMLRPE
jgi:hypothetical protein